MFIIITLYIDDINIIGTQGEIPKATNYLEGEFEMKDIVRTKFYLGFSSENTPDLFT